MCNMSFAMAFVDVIQLVFKKHFFKSECDYVIVHMCEWAKALHTGKTSWHSGISLKDPKLIKKKTENMINSQLIWW